jgi:signal transduction histidine kinase
LFQNLIINAIKYHGPEEPRVVITAENRAGDWLFSFQDNGMGIAPEHQQNIFGVFKRLHGSDIPGTGIGLAICQRLLEQYGGRIWVESELDKGSTFYFLIPAAAAERADAVHLTGR